MPAYHACMPACLPAYKMPIKQNNISRGGRRVVGGEARQANPSSLPLLPTILYSSTYSEFTTLSPL